MIRRAMIALCLTVGIAGAALAQKSPSGPAPSGGGNPSFRLENRAPNVVNNVYISLSATQNWGPDRLGANEVVQPGATRAFNLPVGDCMYDIRVVYQGGVGEERRRLNTCTNNVVLLPMSAQRAQ
ncbi:MAG: hypothetical protein JWR10_3037 [Rubritepida sp.]|nr:hypothetical protein [Rubritepida sp.]